MQLIIGNKNYSSWSLRPWLVMRHLGLAFEETRIALHEPGTKALILQHSPSGRVPVLLDDGLTVWDSLAICEYLAERNRGAGLWPQDLAVRAQARSFAAEMHSGFAALRSNMPMDIRAAYPGMGRTPEVIADIARIMSIFTECRQRWADVGPFLFGKFSIADAMFAPVIFRFATYSVALPELPAAYVEHMLALPAMQEWADGARAEPQRQAELELSPKQP